MIENDDFSGIENEFSTMSDQEKEQTVDALKAVAVGLKEQPKPKKKSKLKTVLIVIGLVLLFLIIGIIVAAIILSAKLDDAVENAQDELNSVMEQELDEDSMINDASGQTHASGKTASNRPDDETWAIYWYICGTDLESDYGCATDNLAETFNREDWPNNLTFVVEAGGTKEWANSLFSDEQITRFVCDKDTQDVVDVLDDTNMGDPDTLADFLEFATENYPADNTMIIFWNHGGGSLGGACFDELNDFDSLTLPEMAEAFSKVYKSSESDPPIDIIGFDCCLMATLDVANVFSGYADYMVASEETEPGSGWDYETWVNLFYEEPNPDPYELSKLICDSYLEYNMEEDPETCKVTLSVLDLNKVPALVDAYDKMGEAALEITAEDSLFYTGFSRAASNSKNFGGRSAEVGFTGMVDLGDFAKNVSEGVDEAKDVLDALDDAVLYNVTGPYACDATGVSIYHDSNGDPGDVEKFIEVGAGKAFKVFYALGVFDDEDPDTRDFLSNYGIDMEEYPKIAKLTDFLTESPEFIYKEDERASVNIGGDIAQYVSSVDYQLYFIDEEYDAIRFLGRDDEIDADWENGVFTEHFGGMWGYLNGFPLFMDLTYDSDEYNEYTASILIDDYEAFLKVYYDFEENEWVVGNVFYASENGYVSRDIVEPEEGATISVLCYEQSLSGDDELEPYIFDEFTYDGNWDFEYNTLEDGEYALSMEFFDAMHNRMDSDILIFEMQDGNIYY